MRDNKIIIIDDSNVVRQAYASMLSGRGFEVVCAAASPVVALAAMRLYPEATLILDIDIPEGDGLIFLERNQVFLAGRKIVVLSDLPEEIYSQRCLALGARAYIQKGAHSELIACLVRQIAKGAFSLSGLDRGATPSFLLDNYEITLLRLVSNGYTEAKIALAMMVGESDIDGLYFTLINKLGLGSIDQLGGLSHSELYKLMT